MDRYFIVFDDVWEVRTWEAIELALVENNLGSKVITTTRNFDVAKASGKVYKLKPLSYDDSMKLFYTRLSGADRKFHEISEKILKKCAGIPLAIITWLVCWPVNQSVNGQWSTTLLVWTLEVIGKLKIL